jgi:hypothetical protein
MIATTSTGAIPSGGATPRDSDDALRLHLSRRDVPCPACGYNLRGLTSGRCAECGAPLELHVGSARARLAWWTTPLAAVAGVFMFALTMSVSGAAGALDSQFWMASDWSVLFAFAAWTVFSGAWLAWVVARRHAVAARPRTERWLRGLATTALAIIAQTGAIALIAGG